MFQIGSKNKCQCEKLQKQLKRYETKFSDLVSSYKTLIDEKKVLEATLKTLSSNTFSTCSSAKAAVLDAGDGLEISDGCTSNGDSESDAAGSSSSPDEPTSSTPDVKLLEEKVSMLSKALNSVTEGKGKMEAAFQNDRKALIMEHSKLLEKAEEEKKAAIELADEMKAKLRQEQLERDAEGNGHGLMLKELQELLSAERSENDVLKLIINEKLAGKSGETSEQHITSGKENIIASGEENIIVSAKNDLKLNEGVEQHTSEAGKEDRHEGNENEECEDYCRLEEMKANLREELLKERHSQEEKHIVELENRLSELSDLVGTYDRKRYDDQLAIRKLREKLENLEVENSSLNSSYDSIASNKSECVGKGQQMLLNYDIDCASQNDGTHLACQEEYKLLLEEFDLYKRKNKYRVSKNNPDEIVEYKKNICRLEKEMDRLKIYSEEKERNNLKIISALQIAVTRSKEEFEEKAVSISLDSKIKIEQMESELRKQRIRTTDLIVDRDMEIEKLQNKLFDTCGTSNDSSSPNPDPNCSKAVVINGTSSAKTDEFSLVDELSVGDGSGLFYFTQQVAHYDAELYSCRMHILDLQSQVRDFEKKEDHLLIQMQALKEEIRNLERNKSRESANMEYLKNICLQYMLTDSLSVKSQMSLAISTVLMFSPEEVTQIRKRQKGGWW